MKTPITVLLVCAFCHAQSVTIINSGSTNTGGFQITVDKSGKAVYTSKPQGVDRSAAPKVIRKTIPKSLRERLYLDVMAASPLSLLPPQRCVKSVSFGTRLTIGFEDDISPDLSCGAGGNAKLQALIRDAYQVLKFFRPE